MTKLTIITLAAAITAVGCTSEGYETGDSQLSYMRADFVEVHTDGDKAIDCAVTDDGERLAVAKPFHASWAERPDTLYRALLYYNRIGNTDSESEAEVIASAQIMVVRPHRKDEIKDMRTDPVTFESLWMSRTGRYLNLGFTLKTGTPEDDKAVQTVAVANEGTVVSSDGKKTAILRFFHDQGGVPQYYSSSTYISIPMTDFSADSVRFAINTYQGEMVKTVAIKH